METIVKSIHSYLSFKIGGEFFSANVSCVQEIIQMTKVTKVPQAPDYMRGIINLRGKVLPVLNTHLKMNLPVVEQKGTPCIVVFQIAQENENLLFGAVVDEVVEVFDIDDSEINQLPTLGSKLKTEFIRGVVKRNDNFIMLLNIAEVFTSDEIFEVKETGNLVVE